MPLLPEARSLLQTFKRPLLVLLAVLPLSVAVPVAAQATVATDKAALVALYTATDGANWTTSTNWTSEMALSSWYGQLRHGPRVRDARSRRAGWTTRAGEGGPRPATQSRGAPQSR